MNALRKAEATGGTFTLTVRGSTSAPLPFNASPAEVDATVAQLAEKAREGELLARWRLNDPAAWREVYGLHNGRLTNLALRFLRSRQDAEELANDALRRAHRRLDTFRGEASLTTWLTVILRNLAINRADHNRRRREAETCSLDWAPAPDAESLANTIVDRASDLHASVEMKEIEAAVARALPTISPMHHAVLVRRMQGAGYRKMAAEFGMPVGSVKSRLARARAELRWAVRKFL